MTESGGQPQEPQIVYVQTTPIKTPGTGALVLSILGFCGITALLGVVLGFVARGEAKRNSLSTGKATAAIVIGLVWLVPLALGMTITAITAATSPSSTSSSSSATDSAPEPTAISQSDLVGGAWTVCKENAQDQLKSPSSASFPLYTSSDIQTQVDGNVVGIVAWVEAENSLGVMVRTPFSCSASYNAATDSYMVFAELDSSTMPTATKTAVSEQDEVLAVLKKRGFNCTGPQGKFDLYQCRKGTIEVPTYGEQPKELVNVSTETSGLSVDGYATPPTVKALAKFGVTAYGEATYGARSIGNSD